MIDKISCKNTINGIDHTRSVAIKIVLVSKKMKRISLPFHLKCLNFRAKSGISATRSRLISKISPTRKYELKTYSNIPGSLFHASNSVHKISGKKVKKSVFKGVGTPIKDSDCRVSKLNLANLNMDMNGINKPTNGKYLIDASILFGTL